MTDTTFYSKERYEDEIVSENAPWPDYEAAVREAIRRIREEDALVREDLSIGIRMSLKPIDKGDMTISLMDSATARIVARIINEEDETITEDEVVNRLEALLEDN
jgi:hypothetical protein